MKNQWGWGGFTTQDLKRCRLLAGMVTLTISSVEPRRHGSDGRTGAVTGEAQSACLAILAARPPSAAGYQSSAGMGSAPCKTSAPACVAR